MSKLRILSLGAGVQSSTLALMAEYGEIERPDYAIFADTGAEPKAVYEYLDYLETLLSFPVLRIQHGNIRDDLIAGTNSTSQRFAAIPFFTGNGGMGRRQCTNEYKIQPIRRKCRELLGFSKGQRIPAGSIEMLVGISLDEASRQKPSDVKWIVNRYPLLEKRMTRGHCLQWMADNGFKEPPKSSCLYCPYHNDKMWDDLKKGDEWGDIVFMDSVIRKQPGFNEEQYMHASLKPIDQAVFKVDDRTIDMFQNECSGMCGV